MNRQTIVLLAATLLISLVPLRSAAQGPQGVGAGEAARAANPGYNPISWLKKKPQTPAEALDSNSALGPKLAARLEADGVLPSGASLAATCETFQDLDDCVATLHAAQDLKLNFDCLKSKVTGVQVNVDNTSICKSVTDGKPVSLSKAIRSLDPDVNSKAEAETAERAGRVDLAETSS
jgi:hypothetical protein